jgi:hypothetical protein
MPILLTVSASCVLAALAVAHIARIGAPVVSLVRNPRRPR